MSFQLPATTTASNTSGFSFGLGTPATAASGGLGGLGGGGLGGGGLGGGGLAQTSTAAATPPSFSFGASGGGDAGSFGQLGQPQQPKATTAPTTTLLGGAPIATVSAPALVAATTTAAAAAPPTFSFGAPASAAAAKSTTSMPTLTLGTTTSTASIPPATTAGPVASIGAGGGFANLSTATKTTDSSAVVTAGQVSYNQLEEHINKWTLELEEQEKVFLNQATQINAWDKILIGNNQKILELNEAVQKVKTEQHALEQELEYISTQHRELEESIGPLQKEFMKIPQVDVERSQTYLMAENLDTQLKQMSEDLKEIVDNLNEANKSQDINDPILQIGKILNAHMSSLQWIESSSANICNKLDEITEIHENFKRDSERSFRSAYFN